MKPASLKKMYEGEIASRTPRTSFYNCLKNAAKQFYVRQGEDMYVISGFPWGVVLARNTFMALPGLTLAIDHTDDYRAIMATAMRELRDFMTTGATDGRLQGIDLPDIPLWAAWAMQQYDKALGREEAARLYAADAADIADYVLDNHHPNLRVDPHTGLLHTLGTATPASWMNSMLYGRPVIPRSGMLVEFNALWYNALVFAAKLGEAAGIDAERRQRWTEAAEKMAQPFIDTFLNEAGYLYDYVNGSYADPAVRPNMAVAIGLDYSPLDRRQRKGVLDVVTRELLTPKGLRTLSPKSYGYRPFYLGSPEERELAMHNGPARPWLIGFYADAYLRVFGMSGVSYIDRMLIGFEDEMTRAASARSRSSTTATRPSRDAAPSATPPTWPKCCARSARSRNSMCNPSASNNI